MKKVTAFIGTQTKKATYHAVQEFEKNLKQYGEIDFEYVFLSDITLSFAGAASCALIRERNIVLKKMTGMYCWRRWSNRMASF